MKILGKINWTIFVWFIGLITGALGIATWFVTNEIDNRKTTKIFKLVISDDMIVK